MFGVVRARIAHKTGYGQNVTRWPRKRWPETLKRDCCSVTDTGRVGVGGGQAVRRPGSPPAAEAMTLQWFSPIGLVDLSRRAATCWKPPSTLAGVRGGNREESC
jgi:hypothetical protein